ncbi:16S rRNA (uracil(1498)-N(3))-methyltransferase [Macrococcus equipercicus]|uniref:Ribosomal RNA small subunit methyltransferase E n=1 Tax=Macrococcus equipercicus TaxID=69967 RepID=A0A9Q9F0N4_9STAP|nr:16S rRNA (uracil(1498)-N(3))-methyltransferase [Macrococcus equipercicus]KAA1040066.1 16S rRNA (uracil(1498)-N(3))-methyltransferase [Macrococcus equipercicus]UTH12985.1 16S rRNA (uracil(1498)-N(3))-methyltransferase [Macrococcus equipercicus]
MQRYFLAEDAGLNERFTIQSADDVHHIKNVMRSSAGDQIIVNFRNGVYVCRLTAVDSSVEVEATEALDITTELPVDVTIASGLLKNDKYEWMIQKATELGAAHFIPFVSERTIIKVDQKKMEKRLERFNKIVKEAAEQSYRRHVPTVTFQPGSKALAELTVDYDQVLVAYEEEAKAGETKKFHAALKSMAPGTRVLIIFGPEGGLSAAELEIFGGRTIGLGPRILRAETAPLYALSAVSYFFELMV